MGLPVIALVAAAALGGGYLLLRSKKDPSGAPKPSVPSSLPQPADHYEKGKVYAMTYAVDAKALSDSQTASGFGSESTDPIVRANAFMKNVLASTGMTVLSGPTLKTETDARAFLAGQPSTWVVTFTWDSDEKYITTPISWLGQALSYAVPAAPPAGGVATAPSA